MFLPHLIRAVNSTIASLPASQSTPGGEPVECLDIRNCRTLKEIITSCLSVIIICIWTSVHPNVPVLPWGELLGWALLDYFSVTWVAIICPELIVVWAWRQRHSAKAWTKIWKDKGHDNWTIRHSYLAIMGGLALYNEANTLICLLVPEELHNQSEWEEEYGIEIIAALEKEGFCFSSNKVPMAAVEQREEGNDQEDHHSALLVPELKLSSQDEDVSRTQPAHDINDPAAPNTRNRYPPQARANGSVATQAGTQSAVITDYTCLLELLWANGYLRITENEIDGNVSHSDLLTKVIAIVQTTWFIAQAIARGTKGLAITELECLTLAFAAFNAATFILWWKKPSRVRYPLRIYLPNYRPSSGEDTTLALIRELLEAHEEVDDLLLDVRQCWTELEVDSGAWKGCSGVSKYRRMAFALAIVLPLKFLVFCLRMFICIFWGFVLMTILPLAAAYKNMDYFWTPLPHDSTSSNMTSGILGTTLVIGFGALHYIPLAFPFLSETRRILWIVSAAITTGAALFYMLVDITYNRTDVLAKYAAATTMATILLALMYITSRCILIVLAFDQLRHLPYSAFQTADWTKFIIHIG